MENFRGDKQPILVIGFGEEFGVNGVVVIIHEGINFQVVFYIHIIPFVFVKK